MSDDPIYDLLPACHRPRQEPPATSGRSPGEIAASLALGQLVKELTVGLGMSVDLPEEPDKG